MKNGQYYGTDKILLETSSDDIASFKIEVGVYEIYAKM